jgi:lipopolysaccharide transport system permease protein
VEQIIYKKIRKDPVSAWSYLTDAWQSRNLVLIFARRDLKVQYAQTYLGITWSVLQPLTALIVFSFFFQHVVTLNLHVPYVAFVFTGIMGWFYFTSLVGNAGTALLNNQQIIKKLHFPYIVLPLSRAVVGLVELGISLVILSAILLFTGGSISFRILYLPLVIIANMFTGLSIGLWLSALTIRFRDLHHIIPFIIGFGIWITPVFYPRTMVPKAYSWIYYFHPIANVISLYRWIFLELPVNWPQVFTSFIVVIFIFISGLFFFIRNEKFVAEHL